MIEKNELRMMRLGSALVSVGVLGLLAAGSALAADYELEIKFEDNCPVEVVDKGNSCTALGESAGKDKACAKRKDKLVWKSNPEGKSFTLYFDPLKGGPKYKGNRGEYSRHIDADAPIAAYKYTIVSPGCEPFDPRIVIRPN